MSKCKNPKCHCEDCQCGDDCHCGENGNAAVVINATAQNLTLITVKTPLALTASPVKLKASKK